MIHRGREKCVQIQIAPSFYVCAGFTVCMCIAKPTPLGRRTPQAIEMRLPDLGSLFVVRGGGQP
jgi:hypothetical protein